MSGSPLCTQPAVHSSQTGCVELFTATVVLSELALFNSNTLLNAFWRLMKSCMGRRFCDAVVWIAELVNVKNVGN